MGTPQAFEGAVLETFRTGRDGNRHHPHLALRTTRAVDRQQLGIGFRRPGHSEN
jgi:hypothetical protein